ncbi:MAG: bifunctional phosphoribosyl-AMP cyclohydrolase/phosphoribosyl-ATP diphosphatase HisIE [Ferruginibacter sp.]
MQPNFSKYTDHLMPAIIQDFNTNKVLMLGFMNEVALEKTIDTKRVTFFSRSKNRLWTKGEESGHYLELCSLETDCDEDTLLIKAIPHGPVCHTGADTCWNEINTSNHFIDTLESIIKDRRLNASEKSYTSSLFEKGINKIAQKVGEEAVELVIEAKDSNDALFINEAADLLFHYLILLQAKGFTISDVEAVLKDRHAKKS